MKRKSEVTIATATAAAHRPGRRRCLRAQDKYSLKSPSGIAFSDFKGYEDWAVISSARTDEVLKVIVGNPTVIQGVQGRHSRQRPAFPGWLQDREAPVEAEEEEHGGPLRRGCARRLLAGFPHGKGRPEISSGGWGYAVLNYDPNPTSSRPDAASASDCGHVCHGEGGTRVFHLYQKR
jgi:hypothetical protein